MRHPRDFQRARLYRAEPPADHEPDRFLTLADVAAFVRRVQASRWWKSHVRAAFSALPIEVRPHRQGAHGVAVAYVGCDAATGWRLAPIVVFPQWAWNRHTILHELAHIAAGSEARHGPAFASMYLKLLKRFHGTAAWSLLQQSFIRCGVRFRARRKQNA